MESDKAEKPPAETPLDHLSIDPKHSYYNEAILNRGIGIASEDRYHVTKPTSRHLHRRVDVHHADFTPRN